MKKEIKDISASIRAKLLNIAKKENIDFNLLLLRYFQERLLWRLANSNYQKQFLLKGGLYLMCLKLQKTRPTRDIDLLARQVKNEMPEIEKIFRDISEIKCNDGVQF